MTTPRHYERSTLNHDNFFSVYHVSTYFLFNQIFKQYLLVALIFTFDTGSYEKDAVGNISIFKGVVDLHEESALLVKF